jgi:CRISPR-associated protein Cmr3
MTTWIIEPLDPLIVRDGRPFGPTPGARAASLTFPFPSTTTGAVRTRDGLDGDGRFQPSEIPRIKQIGVRGPFLVELDSASGDIANWFAPAPLDALLLDLEPFDSAKATLKRLVPLKLPLDVSTDLPSDLLPVGMAKPDPRKPLAHPPRYWFWDQFEKWLCDPQEQEAILETLGCPGPTPEERMHVRLDPDTQAAAEGALFQTRGLEFTYTSDKKRLSTARSFALAFVTEAPNVKPGIAPLGGERRLVNWRRSTCALPGVPAKVRTDILKNRHCRVILLTPAHFVLGSQPTWLRSLREGVKPSLQAIAVSRYQVVSGWDLEWTDGKTRGRPKPTRRLAPAGTTLFLQLAGDDDAINRWIDGIDGIWMQCVSDEAQDRLDGFGLAVLGTWDGNPRPMEIA